MSEDKVNFDFVHEFFTLAERKTEEREGREREE